VTAASVIDEVARATGFSGVVRLDAPGEPSVAKPYGLACRRHDTAMTVDAQIGVASGGKGLTALTVMSLVVDGILALDTTARSLLGDDLPLVADDVTIGHLLAHRSGIGDYLDEDDQSEITDYVLAAPVHELATSEDFLRVLGGHPTAFPAGERFAYCNGGFVLLALLAERAGGRPFHDLVAERVCAPAGMADTAYLRSDELPGGAAVGYLHTDGLRTNVLHLPVRGSGDGGVYTTAADVHAFWAALFGGRIVPADVVAEMTRPRSDVKENLAYGLGFWLRPNEDSVFLEGYDAGASFRSLYRPSDGLTWSVLSNTSEGAWPIARALEDVLSG
jgi:CubicO group peptidase (beta-lactamase class C family)